MKTSQIARGIVGALSLAGVIGAIGCSADAGYEGAAGEGEIGSTSQALLAVGEAMFPAYINLDANTGLVVGGFDPTDGSGTALVAKYDAMNGYTALTSLPAARGAAQIVAIPGTDKFLVSGGSTTFGGNALATSLIYDVSDNNWTALAGSTVGGVTVNANMSSARKFFTLDPCGTGSGDNSAKAIAIGGIVTEGPSVATNTMDVFTFRAGNGGADSGWLPLKSPAPATLNLATARGFHEVIPVLPNSTRDFLVVAGLDGSSILGSTELVSVSTSCDAATKTAKASLPTVSSVAQHRAKFASASINETVSTKRYVGVVAGGTHDGSDAPVEAFRYDIVGNTWDTANSISQGRTFLTISPGATAGTFIIAAGLKTSGSPIVSDVKQVYTPSTNTWATAGTFTDERVGNWQLKLGSTPTVGNGGDDLPGAGVVTVSSVNTL